MADEQKTEQNASKFIDDTYKVHEMIDELEAADANASKLIKQQERLIEVIEANAKEGDVLKALPPSIKVSNDNLKARLKINEFRIGCFKRVLFMAKDDINIRYSISMLLEGLGIVNAEALPFEQRPELALEEDSTEEKKTN